MDTTRYLFKKIRKKIGFKTQQQLADYMKYSKTHISDIETGKSDPSFGFVEDFVNVCNSKGYYIENVWEVFKKG